jgi:hypothetical protein
MVARTLLRVRVVQCCLLGSLFVAATSAASVFNDDFNGSTIDPTLWSVSTGGGTVTVAGGRVTLSAPCGAEFPYVVTLGNPFPTEGDFVVRVGFRYRSVSLGGNGFGFDYNMRAFGAWQDSCSSPDNPAGCGGLRVAVGDLYPIYLTDRNSVDTAYHVYQWEYIAGTYRFSLDGTLVAQNTSTARPDKFFFGHPLYAYCNWTTQEIDFVHIEALPVVPVEPETWGAVKDKYRGK